MTDAKHRILNDASYQYDFNRDIYFNYADKKIFTKNAVDDHDENWLLDRLAEKRASTWVFYANDSIDPKVKRAILKELT